MRPFLKWAGNKYQCLKDIVDKLPPGKRLIEPFTGSAAIFLNTNYSQALLSDVNPDIINLFKFLQTRGANFIKYSAKLFNDANNCESKYYEFRKLFNTSSNKYLKAAIFVYLNRHGFNGLCRYNLKGEYNVPFGRYKKPYFPKKELENFITQSLRAQFICKDFRHTFSHANDGDIIYCDPPYLPAQNSQVFTSYAGLKFGLTEHIELAKLAGQAQSRGAKVIISNFDNELTRKYYQPAQIHSFLVKRYISCIASKRTPAQELLAIY